jgi:RNA polymerase sigma factor (TIGR02999 family)
MEDITRILNEVTTGDSKASEQLLPLIYEDLRKLAAARLALEKAGQTLQPTALVHEAYLRLVQGNGSQNWNGRAHFFGAAAEAMRRILVDIARRKVAAKRGGNIARQNADLEQLALPMESEMLLALDQALNQLYASHPNIARLVQLRFFSGISMEEAADILGVSIRTAHRQWLYAKAFLRWEIDESSERPMATRSEP